VRTAYGLNETKSNSLLMDSRVNELIVAEDAMWEILSIVLIKQHDCGFK
jgi:hypothetical protein